jgi:hypothetical protein
MVQVADAYLKANPDGPKASAPPAPGAAAGGGAAAAPKFTPEIQAIQDDATQLRKFPVGWGSWSLKSAEGSEAPVVIILKILGLILTAIAISLGAPFWFDLLNTFMNLRATGEKPVKAGNLDAGNSN